MRVGSPWPWWGLRGTWPVFWRQALPWMHQCLVSSMCACQAILPKVPGTSLVWPPSMTWGCLSSFGAAAWPGRLLWGGRLSCNGVWCWELSPWSPTAGSWIVLLCLRWDGPVHRIWLPSAIMWQVCVHLYMHQTCINSVPVQFNLLVFSLLIPNYNLPLSFLITIWMVITTIKSIKF